MSLKLFIFEDEKFENFYPLTYNRPTYELLSGMKLLREKISWFFPQAEASLLCRDYLAEVLQANSGLPVNSIKVKDEDELLFLNGRILASEDLPSKIGFSKEEKAFVVNGDLAAFNLPGSNLKKYENEAKSLYLKEKTESIKKRMKTEEVKLKLVNYVWDLVEANANEIKKDFKRFKPGLAFEDMFKESQIDPQTVIYDPEKVFIGKNCRIDAQVVLDARGGPIYIDEGTNIQAQTRIEGPVFVGNNSLLVGGKIFGGCSIGNVCRVGGEVEESIFLGYSNKYHQGFLGHSYIGEWVNLGAMTTNSDLKNNYKPVKVTLAGKEVDTKMLKVGSFIGDHVKTGIGTLLNTGINVGLGCNIFGGGMVEEKFVPSFSWGKSKEFCEYEIDKFLVTTSVVMQRRKVELTEEDKKLFKKIFDLTEPERRLFQYKKQTSSGHQ